MKDKERSVLRQVNDYFGFDMKEVYYKYCNFDAYDENYIMEIKYRGKHYNDVLIEFNKYTFNKEYAKLKQKNFIYAVGLEDVIYLFNISHLNSNGYNYKWHWKKMPKQTEFEETQEIMKFVGYIDIKMATRIVLEKDEIYSTN